MSRSATARGFVAIVMAAGLVLVGGSAAFAQDYTPAPAQAGLSVSDDTVVAGQSIDASGTNWTDALKAKSKTPKAGLSVALSIGGVDVGTAQSDAAGNFLKSVIVPDLPAGDYPLTASAEGTVVTVSLTLHVGSGVGGSGASNGGGLARTGTDLAPLAGAGIAALVLGSAAVYGTRRRRNAA